MAQPSVRQLRSRGIAQVMPGVAQPCADVERRIGDVALDHPRVHTVVRDPLRDPLAPVVAADGPRCQHRRSAALGKEVRCCSAHQLAGPVEVEAGVAVRMRHGREAHHKWWVRHDVVETRSPDRSEPGTTRHCDPFGRDVVDGHAGAGHRQRSSGDVGGGDVASEVGGVDGLHTAARPDVEKCADRLGCRRSEQ